MHIFFAKMTLIVDLMFRGAQNKIPAIQELTIDYFNSLDDFISYKPTMSIIRSLVPYVPFIGSF